MARKLKAATGQRGFTIVYNDFLESEKLDAAEKIVFIALKRFTNAENLQAFPSVSRLQKITGLSKRKVQYVLEKLEEKGVLRVEHRDSEERGHMSNLYTLYDFASTWNSAPGSEASTVDQMEELRAIEMLQAKGYSVTKEKTPVSVPTTEADATKNALNNNAKTQVEINSNSTNCQEIVERYPIEDVRAIFDYETMIENNKAKKNEIDAVFDIIYDVLNTKRKELRIAGEDKPAMAVIGRFMKLEYESILYVLDKYARITDKISRPTEYLRTMLYNAPSEYTADIVNQVSIDLH